MLLLVLKQFDCHPSHLEDKNTSHGLFKNLKF